MNLRSGWAWILAPTAQLVLGGLASRPCHLFGQRVRTRCCLPSTRVVNLQACAKKLSTPLEESSDMPKSEVHTSKALKIAERATSLFPVWVVVGALIASYYPPAFLWFKPKFIVIALAFIMAGMGLTLSVADFALAFSRPGMVLLGVASQYCIMPTLGYVIANVMRLPRDIAIGLILVAVCPGGAASNLVCLIGHADVALSVVLTLCSTLLSIVAIPSLMKLLAGQLVAIDTAGLLFSTVQVVLLPLFGGFLLKAAAPLAVTRAAKVLPLISVIGVVLICGSVVASTALSSISTPTILALALLHALGGVLGYWIARLFHIPVRSARTISIEVMMQNSSLAVALALAHFASPLTAVPG